MNNQNINNFLKDPRTNWDYILIVVILGIFAGGGILGYYYLWITDLDAKLAELELKLPEKVTKDETANWQTISGEIAAFRASNVYKFEFEAPQEFQIIRPYPTTASENDKYYFGAEAPGVSIYAGLMEGPGPLTVLYGRANQSELCSKPLEVQELTKGSFEVCDILKIDGRDALLLIDVYIRGSGLTTSCERGASFYVVYNIRDYSSLMFTLELAVLEEIIEPWAKIPVDGDSYTDDDGLIRFCPRDVDYSEVKENFTAQVMNIRNAENLSEGDIEKLRVLYQILSTFKFIE